MVNLLSKVILPVFSGSLLTGLMLIPNNAQHTPAQPPINGLGGLQKWILPAKTPKTGSLA